MALLVVVVLDDRGLLLGNAHETELRANNRRKTSGARSRPV